MVGWGPPPGHRLLVVFSQGRRGQGVLSALYYKSTNHVHEGPSLMISIPQTLTSGVRFPT